MVLLGAVFVSHSQTEAASRFLVSGSTSGGSLNITPITFNVGAYIGSQTVTGTSTFPNSPDLKTWVYEWSLDHGNSISVGTDTIRYSQEYYEEDPVLTAVLDETATGSYNVKVEELCVVDWKWHIDAAPHGEGEAMFAFKRATPAYSKGTPAQINVADYSGKIAHTEDTSAGTVSPESFPYTVLDVNHGFKTGSWSRHVNQRIEMAKTRIAALYADEGGVLYVHEEPIDDGEGGGGGGGVGPASYHTRHAAPAFGSTQPTTVTRTFELIVTPL